MPVYDHTSIDHPAGSTTIANAINASGQIVGTYSMGVREHGFLDSNGAYTTVDDPLGTSLTSASGINASGQIVGFYADASGDHGLLFSNANFTPLNDPLAINGFLSGTFAAGLNDAGQIVGTYTNASGTHGFFLANGFYAVTLNPPLAPGNTHAQAINNRGQIVGYYSDNASKFHGFLYDPTSGTYTTLDDPLAARDTQAWGINDAGQIVVSAIFLVISDKVPSKAVVAVDSALRCLSMVSLLSARSRTTFVVRAWLLRA
jgi:probable HAF family extracellular repeat protein